MDVGIINVSISSSSFFYLQILFFVYSGAIVKGQPKNGHPLIHQMVFVKLIRQSQLH